MPYIWVVIQQQNVPKDVAKFYDTPIFRGAKETPHGMANLVDVPLPKTHKDWDDVLEAACLTDSAGTSSPLPTPSLLL